jgi:hypothetical protein
VGFVLAIQGVMLDCVLRITNQLSPTGLFYANVALSIWSHIRALNAVVVLLIRPAAHFNVRFIEVNGDNMKFVILLILLLSFGCSEDAEDTQYDCGFGYKCRIVIINGCWCVYIVYRDVPPLSGKLIPLDPNCFQENNK